MSHQSPRTPAMGFIFVTFVLGVLGFGLLIPVLPRLVTQFQGGDVAAGSHMYGALIGVFALTQLFFAPILGALSDRFGRRRVIPIGAFGGLAEPAMQGVISRHVPADEQGAVQGALTGFNSLAGIIGPPAAAWSFGYCISSKHSWQLPGIAFFESASLVLIAAVIAYSCVHKLEPVAHTK